MKKTQHWGNYILGASKSAVDSEVPWSFLYSQYLESALGVNGGDLPLFINVFAQRRGQDDETIPARVLTNAVTAALRNKDYEAVTYLVANAGLLATMWPEWLAAIEKHPRLDRKED